MNVRIYTTWSIEEYTFSQKTIILPKSLSNSTQALFFSFETVMVQNILILSDLRFFIFKVVFSLRTQEYIQNQLL